MYYCEVIILEIKIRNIDPMAVKKIDEWAKEKDLSRQEYLRLHLESFAVNDVHSNIIDRYEKQLEANSLLLEKTTQSLNELIDVLKGLILDE